MANNEYVVAVDDNNNDNNTVTWHCNNCGEVFHFDPLIYVQHCPNCGEEELDCDDND